MHCKLWSRRWQSLHIWYNCFQQQNVKKWICSDPDSVERFCRPEHEILLRSLILRSFSHSTLRVARGFLKNSAEQSFYLLALTNIKFASGENFTPDHLPAISFNAGSVDGRYRLRWETFHSRWGSCCSSRTSTRAAERSCTLLRCACTFCTDFIARVKLQVLKISANGAT